MDEPVGLQKYKELGFGQIKTSSFCPSGGVNLPAPELGGLPTPQIGSGTDQASAPGKILGSNHKC